MNNEIRSLKQQQFVDVLSKFRRSILRSSIRFGKTKVALMTIRENEEVLVCYPRKVIKDAWVRDIEKFGVASNNISYSTFASLKKLDKKYSYVIVDECHKLSAKQIIDLFKLVGDRLLMITGTMKFSKKKYWKNRGINIAVEYDLEDAINDKLVKDYKVYIHSVSLSKEEKAQYDKYTNTIEWAETQKLIAEDNHNKDQVQKFTMIKVKNIGLRTNLLYNTRVTIDYSKMLIEKLKDEKVLIFSLRTAVADELSEKSFHSKSEDTDNLDEFMISEKGHLSTVNVINEGITINNLNNIVCHTVTSNTEDFQQKLGRGLQLGEVNDEICEVHLICIKHTVSENWIESACKSLNQEKIYYVVDDLPISKIIVRKLQNPDKELFLYEGSFCYPVGNGDYKFLDDKIDRQYYLPPSKLKKL